ncbi:EamA family transporter [Candidatus Micrarchaeota archaeon]|nr:EamA family transporter [Candidatus Micrarchaeota archaeon]
MDWRIAALVTMLALGAYNILVQEFIKKVDWRIMIPIVFVVSLALFIYFLATYPSFIDTVNPGSVIFSFALAFVFCISIIFTYFSFKEGGTISGVVPILNLSMFVSVLISIIFLKEEVNILGAVGMVLSFIGLILLAYR